MFVQVRVGNVSDCIENDASEKTRTRKRPPFPFVPLSRNKQHEYQYPNYHTPACKHIKNKASTAVRFSLHDCFALFQFLIARSMYVPALEGLHNKSVF